METFLQQEGKTTTPVQEYLDEETEFRPLFSEGQVQYVIHQSK